MLISLPYSPAAAGNIHTFSVFPTMSSVRLVHVRGIVGHCMQLRIYSPVGVASSFFCFIKSETGLHHTPGGEVLNTILGSCLRTKPLVRP